MPMPDFNDEVQKFVQGVNVSGAASQGAVVRARERGQAALNGDRRMIGAKAVGKYAATSLVGGVVTHAAPVTVVSSSVGAQVAHIAQGVGINTPGTFSPIMWAAKPWFAAKDVADVAFSMEKIYAVMGEDGGVYTRKYRCEESYPCTCADRRRQGVIFWNAKKMAEYGTGTREATHKSCKNVRDFAVAQKEAKAARIAVNSTVVGAAFYAVYSAARSVYKRANGTIHQDRALNAQHLVRSALPVLRLNGDTVEIVERGCRRAQALIALLCGELALQAPSRTLASYPKTFAALVHPDGWDRVAAALSAAITTDLGNGKALAAPLRA